MAASWRAPHDDGGSPIIGYKVQWKSGSEHYDDSASSTRQAVITDPNRLGHTIRGLSNGTEYTVRVIATNSVGDGPPSLEESATTHPEPGDEPDGSRGGYGQNGVYTWRDGDRVMRVRLEPGADKQAYGVRESDPVFRSESGGGVMTLPGGVLLALDPLWSASAVDQFFSQNSIKRNRVSPLGFLENAFFVETEPGFPSLDLANDLAEQDGVVISMPNWGMEVETHQTPPEDDDHGDTIDTATVLPLNTRMSGAINSDDDVDVFQFQVSESTLVAVGNFEEGEEGGLHPLVGNYFTIVDASEELVTRGFRNALVRLEAGTYYVKVDVWSLESRWEYDIEVRTIPDQGDTIAASVPISVPNDQSHFAAIGDLTTSDDVDLFKIVVDTVTDVIIDPQFDDVKTVRAWTHTYIPINVNLLDASGDPAHRLANDGVDFFGRPYRLAAGTHYFRISAYQPDPHLRPYVLRLRESTEYAEFIDGCADITPDSIDPLHGCQWHLHNDEDNEGTPGNDINLGDVWQTTKGEGVNVAIIDETVESVHEDLGENWNADLSHNYLGEGQEASHFNDHGTAVAGIVAARDNGKGIIGVAPRASIVGYNILERPFSTFTLTLLDAVDAFTRNMEDIAVSNNSWGVPYLSYDLAPQLWTRALKAGATRGLDGKGVLYVFAAGNGHEIGQHPNLTGTRNSYLQTLACAVDSDGIREYYSEIDYVLWVCAPSANITTDNLNRYRQDFDGTSAAAPIVSGVAALVRSANPSLTWRDVKLILAGSARKTDPDNAGWEEGALKYGSDTERYSYNPEYGFGVVDATAAVELAQDWTTLPPFLNSSAETARTALPIPETENGSDPTPLASKLSVISHVNFIEFVEVHVSVVHPAFRELRITLESPSGTTSVLMPGEGTFEEEVGWWTYMDVPFRMGSARHLGEDPNGTWTLRVSDHWEDIEGILKGWSIKFYGHGDSTAIQRITGTAQVYETLTVDTSRIAVGLTGVEFTYQWLDDGGWWAGEFPGGTNDSYTPGINDTGRTFSVEVSFTDDRNFQSTRTSPPSAVIAPPDGIVWWAMLVGGSNNGAHGYNSFVNYGTLSPNAFSLGGNDYVVKALLSQRNGDVKLYLNQKIPGDFTLDVAGKRRFSSRDARGSEVTNPSKSYYYYTWVNAGFEFPSSDTGWWNRGQRYVIAMSMGLPTISGTALVGETLTAETSDIVDADGLANATFSYQWLADNQDIPGATGDSYSPVSSDVGKTIRVRVSFTDDADNEETLSSAPTAAVFFARPSAPQRLVVSPHGSGALDFHWEAPVSDGGSPITWYYARWKEAAGSWDTPADVSGILLWSTSYPHTITGLTDGVEYAVRVSARNYYSHFGPSAEAHGTPGEPTPPELTGAIVDGDTLVLNYDEDLDETSEPATDAFSVTVGGTGRAVDGVSVSGSSVILTLGSAVASGATVTVSYAAPTDAAAPRIQDDAGNPAASFSDEDVENNTPPPANTPATGAPTITGTAQVGDTLTASTSDIDDADGLDNVGYSYQWLANGADIAGATSSTYTLVDDDAGLTIKVKVSFFDDENNQETLTSAATATVVTPLTAEFQDVPDKHLGTGVFTFDIAFSEPISIGYVTLRDDSLDVTNGSATKVKRVNGQSDLWKITVEPDSDADVTVVLPITEDCGSDGAVCTRDGTKLSNRSELTVPGPAAANSPATGAPIISGTAHVGETLTVDTSGIDDADGMSGAVFSYQWLADGVDIAGATSDTYTPVADDVGKAVKVRVIFNDDDYNEETLTSAATAAVAARPNSPATGAPIISGTARVGETLTVDTSGIDDADGMSGAVFSYQWLANEVNIDTDIAGATDPTYTLVADDVGKAIRVRVSFDDDRNFLETLTSGATATVVTPLTAEFQDAPDKHLGTGVFTFDIAFSEPISIGYVTLRDDSLDVTNGAATKAKRVDGQSDLWKITVEPDSDADVTVVLPITEDCAAQDAVCTRDGTKLSNRSELTVPGPAAANSPATGAPIISGTAQVGETLTVDTSGIDDADGMSGAVFSYQWLADGVDIAGATSDTYTLVDADFDKAVKVRVIFNDDDDNEETLTSEPTAAVAAETAVPDAPQSLNISPDDTGTLDVSWEAPAADGGSAITGYKVQWKSGSEDYDGSAGSTRQAEITDPASRTHTITGLTDGVEYAVRVIAVNDIGDGPPSDEATGTPRETTPPELSTATVDGAALTLTYDEALDENSEPSSDAFSVTVGGTGRAVDGVSVSGSSVILTLGSAVTAADTVTVSYTAPTDAAAPRIQDEAGNPAASFSDQDVENNTPPPANTPATGAPTISGTVRAGESLTAETRDIEDDDGLDNATFSYQWIAGTTNISGATGSTYTLVDDDAGLTIKVKVSFFDDKNNQETLTSAATAAVEPRPNSPATGAPTISGTVRVGETLTADTSAIADADGMSGAVFTYQWLADDTDIAGATDPTYTLVDDDAGLTIKVKVSFFDDKNNPETLTSAATAAVEPRPNSPATGAPTISGTAQVGETLTVDTSDIADADGMSRAVFSYQWLANGADVAGATSDTYTPVADDVGKAIKVKVSFRDDKNHPESLTSAATAAVATAADESAVWSATLTVGSIAGFRGFWKDVGMGELTSEVFTLDGVDYTVKVLADTNGLLFDLTLDKALPVGFTLQVGATTLSSQDASIREYSSGATQYGWANQGVILADVDTVEVSLTLAE